MGKILKTFIAVIAVMLFFPLSVSTAQGVLPHSFTLNIDGEDFEVWYYTGEVSLYGFRLRDIAFMLNGTAAQFNIREINDERWDYWIEPGVPYVPNGTELQPIPLERWANFSSEGEVGGYGFVTNPWRHVLVGVGGVYEPATTVAIRVLIDVDDTFFPLENFGYLFGFSRTIYGININDEAPVLPVQTPEFTDLLVRLFGHWVDERYYISPIINEAVVWPAELRFTTSGLINYGWHSPIGSMMISDIPREHHSLQKNILENGLVELTIQSDEPEQFDDIRIIVDTSNPEIDRITYYIDGVAHSMVRYERFRPARRYYAEPYESGGIRLLYLLRNRLLSEDTTELRFYRSTTQGERGELIYTHAPVNPFDRILFEFIDTSVDLGQIYYYCIVHVSRLYRIHGGSTLHESYAFDNFAGLTQLQMRVDVNEVLGLPSAYVITDEQQEVIAPQYILYSGNPMPYIPLNIDSNLPYNNSNTFSIHFLWIPIGFIAVLTAAFVYKRKQ